MNLYTRKQIKEAACKSEYVVRHWFFVNQIEPTAIIYSQCNAPTFFYSEDIFYKAVYYLRHRPKKHNSKRLLEKISKNIYCDSDLNLVIGSKLNFLTIEQL